jgi:hypothetical protein
MLRKIILTVGGVLLLLVLIIVGLLLVPEWLRVALRDIAIIFMVVLGILQTLLFVALIAVMIGVFLLLRDKTIPILERIPVLLEQVLQTLTRVRGTTEFVTGEVAEPFIQAAGAVARVRAMARSAFGLDGEGAPPAPPKP